MPSKKLLFYPLAILTLAGCQQEHIEIETSDVIDQAEVIEGQPESKTHYSEALGLTVNYEGWENSKIRESRSELTFGDQSIEVFVKDSSQSITEAIEEQFLKDYDSSECFAVLYDDPGNPFYDSERIEMGYQMAAISYPKPESNDQASPSWKNSINCPQDYAEANGVRYFLTNDTHPETLLFVDIGQDGEGLATAEINIHSSIKAELNDYELNAPIQIGSWKVLIPEEWDFNPSKEFPGSTFTSNLEGNGDYGEMEFIIYPNPKQLPLEQYFNEEISGIDWATDYFSATGDIQDIEVNGLKGKKIHGVHTMEGEGVAIILQHEDQIIALRDMRGWHQNDGYFDKIIQTISRI